ncbi:MAG: hypothetical protein C4530_17900 [Desulfobacteraceae bacterium]|nr:MAG: hypothetical protein C4530_17900 [Desulfobacteraceae bacterium]
MRILIIITSDLYVRNYIHSGAFNTLENEECWYIAYEKVQNRASFECKEHFAGYFTVDEAVVAKHVELLNVLMWKYRKRSSTFMWRFLILYWPMTAQWYRSNRRGNFFLRWLRSVRGLKYPILGSAPLSAIAIPYLVRQLTVNEDILRYLERIRPDLVIIPSSAYDPIGTDVARLKSRFSYKTLFLIDNWDNISSKSIMWALPDHLSVWGEQSKEHAVYIHGMSSDKVTCIGTPRFDSYFSNDPKHFAPPYDFDYILFCGCAEPFDELSALKILDFEISGNPALYGTTKIVYRPHPKKHQRICEDVFRPDFFENVILDRQAGEYHYRKTDNTYQPDLDYYPSLLFNARLVVAPLTTMIIEALICGTNVLAVVYNDGVHYTSPHNTLRYYEHFRGVERIKGLFFCRAKEDLGEKVRQLVADPIRFDRKEMLASLKYFLYHDELSYGERLKKIVRSMIPS